MIRRETDRGDRPLPRFGHTTTLVCQNLVVLFGGATGENGRYTITADTFALDLSTNLWSSVTHSPDGSQTGPSARAAHAAACVDALQLVIYGGATGGGSLSSDELYLLDFREARTSTWMPVPISSGATPGRRYGHSMVFNKPLLITFGGNNGKEAVNDIWTLDVEKPPFTWEQVSIINNQGPLPRVYHSAEVCRDGPAAGMMVVFGGRTPESTSLSDIWGLRQHRDQRWDWVEAPTKKGKPPEARFQHSCLFYNSRLFIFGGRGADVNKSLPTMVYSTESCEWKALPSINRFRHSCWGVGKSLFAYGGFDHDSPSEPTADLQVLDLEVALVSVGEGAKDDEEPRSRPSRLPEVHPHPGELQSALSQVASYPAGFQPSDDIRISNQVFVSMEKDFTHMVRKINIECLEDEGKKIKPADRVDFRPGPENPANVQAQQVAAFTMEHLLQPTTWQPDANETHFCLKPREILCLCDAVMALFKQEEMVLKLRAPIKVYGDIHGQFVDLMRLFARYKSPTDTEGGDIDSLDYLFLGDFVDRGSYSLETICLLFALKIKYPRQIHMLRGNHEDPTINAIYGFRDECTRRLQEDPDEPQSVWGRFNGVFEWMPCGAVIENRILCIHGGVGGSINSVEDISSMPRPLRVAQVPQTAFEQKVTDLLWSDPSDNDFVVGVTMNETRDPDGTGRIVKFGPDRVKSFLEANNLSLIIRAHECVMDGFERFAGGKLMTIFSATDYCGHHKNAGALLFIRRDLTVVPMLIYPQDRGSSTWDPKITMQRPPTPPRAAPRAQRMKDGSEW